MKARAKFNSNVLLLGILVFIAALLIFISLPLVSYAQTGTLGQESPEIYCTYEQDGVAVDGNELTAGTYDVSFVLSGVQNLSVIEITATYDQEQVTVASAPSYLASDDVAGLDSMGYVLSDGNIVFGLVSTNEDCTSVAEDGQIIATVQMTFASDCDPDRDGYITVSENPNLTFLQVDYGDGYDDAYALVDQYTDYTGNLYIMECDVTPGFGHSVSGTLVVMTDSKGSTNGVAVYGEYTIDVYSDIAKTNLVTSVTSSQTVNENNEKINVFNIENLKNGIYYATISSSCAVSRDVVINMGNTDITAPPIAVVACDFDGSGEVTVLDVGHVYANISAGQSLYCDLNGDDVVSVMDAGIVYACAAGTLSYDSLTIE